MKQNKGKVIHINEYGLCEVATDERVRVAFTLDKLSGYAGQPLREIGLRVGTEIVFESDDDGRVSSAEVARAAAAGS